MFALFGWIALSDYVRAEFLRNRNLEFVKAARAMGLSNGQIIRRHVLPNSMTPVITFLPFRMSAAILGLTSLDFLGLGVPVTPTLGDLLRQGKENLDAWWISLPTFGVLVMTLLLLIFIGDALRDALDTRKVMSDAVAAARRRRALRSTSDPRASSTACPSTSPPARNSALVGESGSGKTVTALVDPAAARGSAYQGAIRFEGDDVLRKSAATSCRRCAAATSR